VGLGVVASSPTAAINPANSVVQGPAWTFGGQPLAPVGNIPVTRIRVPLLMGDGGQDVVWDSAAAASTIMGELRGSPDHASATSLYYPGAGHYDFGFPPYFPFFTNTDVAELGGSAQADRPAGRTCRPPGGPRSGDGEDRVRAGVHPQPDRRQPGR
jgi:BAAT / Acyl-CoA thioester hydrolase C terminal